MNTKLSMLVEYIEKQADDSKLWFEDAHDTTNYLRQEIRRVAWLIECATVDQVQNEITRYEERHAGRDSQG